jgi:hypothetical protein
MKTHTPDRKHTVSLAQKLVGENASKRSNEFYSFQELNTLHDILGSQTFSFLNHAGAPHVFIFEEGKPKK